MISQGFRLALCSLAGLAALSLAGCEAGPAVELDPAAGYPLQHLPREEVTEVVPGAAAPPMTARETPKAPAVNPSAEPPPAPQPAVTSQASTAGSSWVFMPAKERVSTVNAGLKLPNYLYDSPKPTARTAQIPMEASDLR